MSVYIKEKPEYLRECIDSVLANTVVPNEIVIVQDGPITDELEATLQEYIGNNEGLFKIVPLETNQGLGLALAEGIRHCSNEIVARMDTDDIAVPNRFELQLKAFEQDPDLDICGGQIAEFETTPDDIIGERRVPLTHDEIVEYQKKRCAFNHMTVMYKKSKVLEAGNYKHCPLMEDDLLWVDMILAGAKCTNLNEYLCKVRTNRDMIARRGGLKYYKKYKAARKRILDTGFITKKQYRKTNRIQLIVCMMPKWLRKKVFFGLLHKKRTNDDGITV
ncbi:MAG: glycosyltransferase [Clostridiales bacterium]|nr:glycosyltransferase [Clostridiales bacterium]